MADDQFLDKMDWSRRPLEISDRVIELWRQYQTELAEHGITVHAKQLELDVWQAMRMAPSTRCRKRKSTTWHTTTRVLHA